MNAPFYPIAAERSIGRVTLRVLRFGLYVALSMIAVAVSGTIASGDSAPPDAPQASAWHALMEGRVQDAETTLRGLIAANPANSYSHQLLCRVYYAEEMYDSAVRECETAAASTIASREEASDNQLWLGRAYGMKAQRAGPIAGFKLARKVQASFTRAVELNPNNVAALNDLGEYDVDAPFIVGGGLDKAQLLVDRMLPRFPAAAHRLLARMADSENDLPTAETEFKRVIAAGNTAEAWIDLAQFYEAHKRMDDAVAAVRSAIAADRNHGPTLVDAASILTAAHRAPDLAERCLRDYLASRAKSDAAPAFKAHLQLSRLLAARGNTDEAAREHDAAAALAPEYARSQHAVQQGL
jgi:tetratricopeptide (TPR) repeat protein